jgi:hypothetical protein
VLYTILNDKNPHISNKLELIKYREPSIISRLGGEIKSLEIIEG